MNIDLKADRVNCQRCVLRRAMTREDTAEAIVPDALPDILRILDTRGFMCLRGKDSSDGRISVTGTAELTVLYIPESGRGVRRIQVSIPMELTGDCPDDLGDALITASLTLTGADARTVNPRKVVVRAECACEARLYMPDTVVNTARKDTEGIFFQTRTENLRLPVSVSEKTFVITDEAAFPESAPAVGEILMANTALKLESAKAVGSRAVVKGAAVTDVLYESKEGGLCRETLTSPFSQIVETDAVGEAADFDLTLSLTGFYASRSLMDESGGDALSLEIHTVAQCVAWADVKLERVTDAYSVQNPVELAVSECQVELLSGRETAGDEADISIPTGERAARVPFVTAGITGQTVRNTGDGCVMTVTVLVSAIYETGSGEVLSAFRRSELERRLPVDCAASARVSGEPAVTVTDSSIDVRVDLETSIAHIESLSLKSVERVEVDEDRSIDKSGLPSVTIVRCPGPDLWELAKAHLSTPELILEASGAEPGSVPEKGTVLLVPRM